MRNNLTLERLVEITKERTPEIENLLAVLGKKEPERPTLFEFYANERVERRIVEAAGLHCEEPLERTLQFFRFAGYDYATIHSSAFRFTSSHREKELSASYSSGGLITDRASLERYQWPDPRSFEPQTVKRASELLPEGMGLMVAGPGGVLENVIDLCGYVNLCYLLADDRALAGAIFDEVGSRLLAYYEQALEFDKVAVIMDNDDWGFNTQTMLSVEDMYRFVIPWHKRIADLAHEAGRPIVLHSCGNARDMYDPMIDVIGLDGKHSFEDAIEPVEKAYEHLAGRLALLGGIDVDYMVRKSPQEIFERSRAMLRKARGGYALGTGNSVPLYVPDENYFALLHAALD